MRVVVVCPTCKHDSFHASGDPDTRQVVIYCAGCGLPIWDVTLQAEEPKDIQVVI